MYTLLSRSQIHSQVDTDDDENRLGIIEVYDAQSLAEYLKFFNETRFYKGTLNRMSFYGGDEHDDTAACWYGRPTTNLITALLAPIIGHVKDAKTTFALLVEADWYWDALCQIFSKETDDTNLLILPGYLVTRNDSLKTNEVHDHRLLVAPKINVTEDGVWWDARDDDGNFETHSISEDELQQVIRGDVDVTSQDTFDELKIMLSQ